MTIPVAPQEMSPTDPKRIGGVWSFIARFNALIAWIKSLSPSGATVYDTGWVTIQTSTASSPLIQARRVANRVEIYIDGFLSMPSGASVNILGVDGVPVDFRPTKTNHRGVISTDARPSIVIANTNGSVVVVNQTGANRAAINASTIGYWVN